MSSQCWICGHVYVTDYCTKCGPPEPLGPVQADFDRIFADDKRERELSHPRIIEDFLDEEYGSGD